MAGQARDSSEPTASHTSASEGSADQVGVLAPLFRRARQADEFEYACTLLRVRGLEASGWDPLEESNQLVQDLVGAMDDRSMSPRFRMRLLLFLYCHITEMNDLYAIPANLLRVCAGDRYVTSPFEAGLSAGSKAANVPGTKAKRVVEMATAVGFPDIANAYDYFLVNRVRNAFYHSAYTLTADSFNITSGPGVTIDRVTSQSVPFSWLLPRVEAAVNLSLQLVDTLVHERRTYTANRLIMGRMGANDEAIPVELVGGEQGLLGFQSPSSQ